VCNNGAIKSHHHGAHRLLWCLQQVSGMCLVAPTSQRGLLAAIALPTARNSQSIRHGLWDAARDVDMSLKCVTRQIPVAHC
jgi:hypothetical protein